MSHPRETEEEGEVIGESVVQWNQINVDTNNQEMKCVRIQGLG